MLKFSFSFLYFFKYAPFYLGQLDIFIFSYAPPSINLRVLSYLFRILEIAFFAHIFFVYILR